MGILIWYAYMKEFEREHVLLGFLKVGFNELVVAGEERPGGEDPAKVAFEEENYGDRDGNPSAA